MIPLYTPTEFEIAHRFDKLPCECLQCGVTFYLSKAVLKQAMNPNTRQTSNYCSKACQHKSKVKIDTFVTTACTNCNVVIVKQVSAAKRHKNTFCSHSCATTFSTKNKTHGTRRSKLEVWIESQLIDLYSKLEIHFNRKDAIGSELDIYIPSLSLAFELNGIFHYEPIYGVKKFNQIQFNDNGKYHACIIANISLCIIDTSQQKYFKIVSSQKYLDIITNIINLKMISG